MPSKTTPFFKGEWLVSGNDPHLSPTTFLVEMSPGRTSQTHFHRNNQFQIFVRGKGTLGAHELGPIQVHYAGAYTGYGPIKADPVEGLAYFTMRPVAETGALYVPEFKDQMLRGPKRQDSSEVTPPASESELKSLRDIEVSELFATGRDEVFARHVKIPPNGQYVCPAPSGTGGQIVFVAAGGMLQGDLELGEWEHVFITPDEAAYTVKAGNRGLEAVVLQFAPMADEYKVQSDRTLVTSTIAE